MSGIYFQESTAMEKKDYISNNLYKMTRNNAEFKPHDNNSASVSAIAGEKSEPVSKAQLRRLSDVYNAKLDLMARLERSLKKLSMLNDDLENIIAKRRQASDFLRSKLNELQQLTEPDGGRELHEYLREVEHLRMEYFRMETEIESLLDDKKNSTANASFWEELSEMKGSLLFKLSFCGMFPLLITILLSAVIVGAAIIFAMKI